ncbi:MAG: MFS transporter [Acidobacteria bacterium]|nr:MFS transporter [Acidobacteriota bacterium]
MEHRAPPQPSPYRFLIEALLFLSYFVFGLSWIGYSPFLKEFQTRYGLSHGAGGLLISSVSFAKIFVPFVAGWLAVRLGIKRALGFGMLCICASIFSPFLQDYSLFLASRFVFGVGGAALVTLFGSAILQWFPPSERPVVNGINGVAVNAGITLSLILTVPLAERFGQTQALTSYAVVSLLLTLGWWVFGRDHGAAESSVGPAADDYVHVLRMKETWYLALGFAGPLSLYLVFNTWLPTFYHQSLGMTLVQGAQLTGLANFVGIPAAIIGGVLTKRFATRKPFIWGSAVVLSLSGFGLFLMRDPLWLTASAVVFGVSLFLWVAPLTTLAMELPGMTPVRFGMVMGVFFGVSYMAAFFAPILVGSLRDTTGSFQPGFLFFTISCWSLAAAGLLLPETGKRPPSIAGSSQT